MIKIEEQARINYLSKITQDLEKKTAKKIENARSYHRFSKSYDKIPLKTVENLKKNKY